jgi:uncharacterized membrane protein
MTSAILNNLKIFGISLFLVLLLDYLWFTFVTFQRIYKPMFMSINNVSTFFYRLPSAIISYLFLAIILTTIWNVFSDKEYFFLYGAICGLFIYGTYNLTNLSTIKNYTVKTTILDTLWGTILFGIICFLLNLFP